ncbi:MAG TPA: bifunctional salicylyl-CoA 5-hydroxylase/oxidoreductase [Baekduia sp.]|uniref:bifunctional salicylyl-CoA 5-hydroxylase/oxidoreductase n=1 Tax=Baekduia sp. TaxID=2600305 RepID=UPI002D7711D1|nr:bifunctional salicylyl-CoA 5-hydroxylase/oxidoreductase [Baekduia sp.]HET6505341.1 bifunctional salicylyl-CoA 5-hydroxylase/oxidoreductase [Baekduia sp.]
MKIAIAGGGPGGLYAAILFRRLGHDVTVWERNAPDDTFGFGVVFSDETLGAFESADPITYREITGSFARWADIDIHYRGRRMTSGGHGFSALSRQRLLDILQRRAADLGADVRYLTEAPPASELRRDHDLVVAADGLNSALRGAGADAFGPTLERRRSKYMWLGTDLVFEAFTFHIVETEHGIFQIHAYPYSDTMSTFIVETDEETWRRAGLEDSAGLKLAPGENDEAGIDFCRKHFAAALDGHQLLGNNSKWLNFHTVRNARWHDGNMVLLGDAAHTAHFSIGSGTKLAMEDAIALAWTIKESAEGEDVDAVLGRYEQERRPIVTSTQRAAQASLEWFEDIARYAGQDHHQFAFNLLTRSRRITYDNLRLRDEGFVADVEGELCAREGDPHGGVAAPPMFRPLRLRGLELVNRVVVSPMDMYSARDGAVGDFHLVHLGSRGVGGAGLVMTEMICVSAEGRITPGCGGLYRDDHVEGWRRITDFIHDNGRAKVGAQIGHSGRKGATKLMWEGIDRPLDVGAWPIVSASPLPYFPDSQVPREVTRADMDEIRDQFVAATRRAHAAGFDLLEVHMAHGYLLSSFLSPLTNVRTDAYGGDLAARARFPLEVLDACRAAWPQDKPLSVRVSATDWKAGGFDGDDAVALARMLREHGVDVVDVSSGQVVADQRPAYGRTFQTPFADRIRHEAGIPTIAVGAISSYDDVNTILLSGRADLCAVGRPHLYDPYWTLHAAADQGVTVEDGFPQEQWIVQYRGGRRRPNDGRVDVRKSPPRSFDAPPAPAPSRWRPNADTLAGVP